MILSSLTTTSCLPPEKAGPKEEPPSSTERIGLSPDRFRRTPVSGLPRPRPGPEPIGLALGIHEGLDGARTSTTIKSFSELSFIAQFVNQDRVPQSVIDCIDGSTTARRYPHYEIEVFDGTGNAVHPWYMMLCGTLNPLEREDVICMNPGESVAVQIGKISYLSAPMPPGRYRLRLLYRMRRETTGGRAVPPGPDAREALQGAWEGTLASDWVTVQISTP